MSVASDVDFEVGLGAIRDLLERNGISPSDVGKIHRLGDVKLYQQGAKVDQYDDDGKIIGQALEVQDLASVVLSPAWEAGPEWPVVQQAKPVLAKPRPAPKSTRGVQTIFIAPDPQIGYRRYDDGTLEGFHDDRAIDLSLQLIRASKPNQIINLGDTCDFAEWSSKFLVSPEFVFTTQPTIDRAHRYLAEQITEAPEGTEVAMFEGNHDNRLAISITKNAAAALRLRQANVPDSWPVMSLQHLLRLDDLGVKYIDGYPAGRLKLAAGGDGMSSLWGIHGERLKTSVVVQHEHQSFVQGHIHRISDDYVTYENDGEALTVNSWSPGCLCKTDGSVPSTKGGTDAKGRPVRRLENWQQGVGIVTVMPDGYWTKEIVPIHNGRAIWAGQEFKA